jgi:hypothetical protein
VAVIIREAQMREPEIVCFGTRAVPPIGGRAVGDRYSMAPAVGEVALNPAVEMSVS